MFGFERRNAPLGIQSRMHQQIRAWRIGKRSRDRESSRSTKRTRDDAPQPNHRLVEKLAAQVVAYRQESREVKGADILQDKGVSAAVRKMVGEYEAKH
jgi:hypothetical protein